MKKTPKDSTRRQLFKALAICVASGYVFIVLFMLGATACWKAYLGVDFDWDDIGACICGPNITIASCLVLYLGITGILAAAEIILTRCR